MEAFNKFVLNLFSKTGRSNSHWILHCSALENITESQVYIEAIFKVFSEDKDGRQEVNSEVVFHAVKESTQTILTSDEVLRCVPAFIITVFNVREKQTSVRNTTAGLVSLDK